MSLRGKSSMMKCVLNKRTSRRLSRYLCIHSRDIISLPGIMPSSKSKKTNVPAKTNVPSKKKKKKKKKIKKKKKPYIRPLNKKTSRYIGVSWYKAVRKWKAQIYSSKRDIYLGSFENEIDAAKAYDFKAREVRGKAAITNFN